jgi:hypothetical protein
LVSSAASPRTRAALVGLVVMLISSGCAARSLPAPATVDDARQLANYRLDALWEATGLSDAARPASEFEQQEHADTAFIRCMAARGYPEFSVVENANGSLRSTYRSMSPTMSDAERRDWYACYARYFDADAIPDQLYSVEQFDYAYSYYRLSLIPCLRGHGFTVSDVPGRTAYLGGMPDSVWFALGASDVGWNPYWQVRGFTGPTSLPELQRECPAFPPGAYWMPSLDGAS